MAGNIKGITVEIGGDTTELQGALADVNKRSRDLQSELKQVERALKFNPGNTELIAQKQQILSEQIENTTEKLNTLKEAEAEVQRQFENGEIGADQFRAFQREIIQTESRLDGLRDSLRDLNNGSPAQDAADDLENLSHNANEAEGSVKELGSELGNLVAGSAAAMGLGEIIEQSLDQATNNAKIEIAFDVPPESIMAVKNAISAVEVYGIDAEAALEGVRKQWALNKDASDETNTAIIKGAAAIAATYGDIDFSELVKITNSFASGLKISNDDALALINSLLKVGFPPDELDMVSEYGVQMRNAGFSVEQIQKIFENGIDTKSWSLDNLLDGVKEVRIRMAAFGQEVPDAMADLLKGTGKSSKEFLAWGKAVAEGGASGSQALSDMASWLDGIKDKSQKNAIATQIFGTMWEDQGQNMISVISGLGNATDKSKQNQDQLNESIKKMDESPAVKMKTAVSNMMTALAPTFEAIANIIAKIADWVAANPKLAATIVTISSAVGILMGFFMALGPIIAGVEAAMPALAAVFAALTGPVGVVIAIIAALIAAFFLIKKHWSTISKWLSAAWEATMETAKTVFGGIGDFFAGIWDGIVSATSEAWDGITGFLSGIWNGIVSAASTIWNGLANVFTFVFLLIKNIAVGYWTIITSLLKAYWNIIVAIAGPVWNKLVSFFSKIWDGVSSTFSTVWGAISGFLGGIWDGISTKASAVFNAIGGFFTGLWDEISSIWQTVWNTISGFLGGIWDGIKSAGTSVFQELSSFFSGIWDGVSTATSTVWNEISGFLGGIWDGIKTGAGNVFDGFTSYFSNIWEGIRTTTQNIWDGIKNAIMTPVNAIRTGVEDMINFVKGLFAGLKLKFPNVKLPHFGLSGHFSLNPPSVPSVTVDWYKNGALFPANSPRLVGMGDASVPEAALPLSDAVLGKIAKMISNNMPGGEGNGLYLNIESFVNNTDKDIEKLANELSFYLNRKSRGRGGN